MTMLLADIRDDDPLRLAEAAKLAFPDGSMTASGLRREAGKGRLVIHLINNRWHTTLADIAKMRELCRKTPTPLDMRPRVYVVGYGPYVKIGFTQGPLSVRLACLVSDSK